MMGNLVPIVLNGMDNKSRPEAIPAGKASNAVNCIFSNDGEIIFPNPGKVSQYTGDCKWLYKGKDITLFVEGGSLKRLNADFTATVLQSNIGSGRAFYTAVGGDVYWANDLVSGKVRNGVNYSWGTPIPPRQPDCVAVSFGGMYAGDYRVAITWLNELGEEGGTDESVQVTVMEGGGIHMSNFPSPPSIVSGLNIYVSSVNGKELYLYGEFDETVSTVTLTKRICTIPLSTQFLWTPNPTETILAHYGRIYWIDGDKLRRTIPHYYWLREDDNYWRFDDSDVQTVVSCPGVLYVGTQNKLYSIRNIDGNGPAVIQAEQDCGTVKGSEAYHQNGISGYCMSGRGILEFRPEGITELSYKDVAIALFETGATTILYSEGREYLIFVGQNPTANPLTNADWQATEISRGSI